VTSRETRCVRAWVLAGSLVTMLSGRAHADDFTKTVDNAYPFTLPELSRERASVLFETTFARLSADRMPERVGALWVQGLRVEAPFYRRAWYVGGEYAFFSGLPAGTNDGRAFLSGNTRVHVRGVWSTFDGLAFGATFAATLPTAGFQSLHGNRLATDAIAVTPHSLNLLRPIDVGLAVLVDARLTLGPVTVQARHGFEFGANPTVIEASQMAVVTTVYVGGLVGPNVSVGAEGEQLYLLDEGVPDAQRLSVLARLGVTWDLKQVILGACAFSTLRTPFAGEADSAFGGVLRLGWTWDNLDTAGMNDMGGPLCAACCE